MSHTYFQPLFNDLGHRSVEATLGTLGVKSPALRNHLRQQLAHELQAGNRILGDPAFDPVFPWTTGPVTFQDLADQNTLHPSLVNALNAEHKNIAFDDHKLNLAGQALKAHYKPYIHQLRAWETLAAPDHKSVVVTSGTGSGKTECFIIPILNDLVGQAEQPGAGPLVGVQALFIYPLNALINSQRERLLAWTYPYKHKVRFCLYNGNTPQSLKPAIINGRPESEVYDRRGLWQSPPPMLITNPTMLEYMLIRNQDRPILEKSQGKLKYIVLDEAHTYIGSQAAELALLIRRALIGFGVTADDVRFIATSATIGSDQQAQQSLKKYLADLAGISPDRVEVIDGQRNIPELPPNARPNQLTVSALCALPDADRRAAVYENETARRLRNVLIQDQLPKTLTNIANRLFGQIADPLARQQEALAWLDLVSQQDTKQDDVHFLPLRGHFFHKVLHGLWACVDRHCPEKRKPGAYLNDPAWGFGYVYTQQRLTCACGSPVYELVFCNECNTGHLKARLDGDRLMQNGLSETDDFLFDLEQPDSDAAATDQVMQTSAVILSQQPHERYDLQHLGTDGFIASMQDQATKPIYWNRSVELCAFCEFGGQGQEGVFRAAYLGMPFYTSSLVPTLLEHVPDGKEPLAKPMRGRNLLTFTDSRQGTARIAVKMQQNAERLRVRGLIYRKIQENNKTDEIQTIQTDILALRAVPNPPTVITGIILEKESQLRQLARNTISWADLVQALSIDEDVRHIHRYYHHELDPDVFDSAITMAKVLLAREFGRRPKRGNSLETLGLTAVYYEGLDTVTAAPSEWQDQQLTAGQWRDFLKICLDFYVREGVYLNIPREWLNWLGSRISPKYLLSPNSSEGDGRTYIPWAAYQRSRGKRQSRIVRFLIQVLGFDLENITTDQAGRLDALMQQAWHALTNTTQLLRPDDRGRFQLRLEKLQFRTVTDAWQCPVTLRVLDTTLNGLTPYLPVRPPLARKPAGHAPATARHAPSIRRFAPRTIG